MKHIYSTPRICLYTHTLHQIIADSMFGGFHLDTGTASLQLYQDGTEIGASQVKRQVSRRSYIKIVKYKTVILDNEFMNKRTVGKTDG